MRFAPIVVLMENFCTAGKNLSVVQEFEKRSKIPNLSSNNDRDKSSICCWSNLEYLLLDADRTRTDLAGSVFDDRSGPKRGIAYAFNNSSR